MLTEQFLQLLHEEGLILPDRQKRQWKWDQQAHYQL